MTPKRTESGTAPVSDSFPATAATECGYCEGHGYTTGSGKLVECPECNGVGSAPATAAPVRCNNRECENYGQEVVLRQDTCPYCGMPTRERLTKPLARFDVAHAIQHFKYPGGPPLASMEAFALADSILEHLIDGGWEYPDA